MDERNLDTLTLAKRFQVGDVFTREQSSALASVIYALLQNRQGCPYYVMQEWMMTQLVHKGGFSEAQAVRLSEEFRHAIKEADSGR